MSRRLSLDQVGPLDIEALEDKTESYLLCTPLPPEHAEPGVQTVGDLLERAREHMRYALEVASYYLDDNPLTEALEREQETRKDARVHVAFLPDGRLVKASMATSPRTRMKARRERAERLGVPKHCVETFGRCSELNDYLDLVEIGAHRRAEKYRQAFAQGRDVEVTPNHPPEPTLPEPLGDRPRVSAPTPQRTPDSPPAPAPASTPPPARAEPPSPEKSDGGEGGKKALIAYDPVLEAQRKEDHVDLDEVFNNMGPEIGEEPDAPLKADEERITPVEENTRPLPRREDRGKGVKKKAGSEEDDFPTRGWLLDLMKEADNINLEEELAKMSREASRETPPWESSSD